MQSLSVTVGFRERIALPPDATVDVRLLGGIGTGTTGLVASQHVSMSAMPTTIELAYDPTIIDEESPYSLRATILAGDGHPIFRGREAVDGLGGPNAAVELVLTMPPQADDAAPVSRTLEGSEWSLTELFGDAFDIGEPPTLSIDDGSTFSVFGGCNRFSGQLEQWGDGIAFPENMAGTLKACPDDIEAIERRFLAALLQVADYVRYGDGLVMMDLGGRAVAHFARSAK
jgi:putative lipoprotein